MASSLTVMKEDNPSTSPLLTGFLLVAVLVLAMSSMSVFGPEADASPLNAQTSEILP
jgi:hypothetical protein